MNYGMGWMWAVVALLFSCALFMIMVGTYQAEDAQWWPVTVTNHYSNLHDVMELDVTTEAPFQKETKVVALVTLTGPKAMVLCDSNAVYKPGTEKGSGQLDLNSVQWVRCWLNQPDKQVGPDDIDDFWLAIQRIEIQKLPKP